jgi:hypothetical protein
MTNDQHNPKDAQDRGEDQPMSKNDEINQIDLNQIDMNQASLLRAGADGELSETQQLLLNDHLADHPESQSQIGFEQALRESCSRVMNKPLCPDALREKVMAMAGQTSGAESAYNQAQTESQANDDYAQRIENASSYTKSQSFWSRSPMLSAAAALLILVAGGLIWQSASFTTYSAPDGFTLAQASYYNQVSDFVIREHNRCCNDQAAQSKLIEHDISKAVEYFNAAFGQELSMPVMTETEGQVQFYGGGDCHVPSTSRSGHMRFDAIDQSGEQISLSLFVSPNPELLPMQEGMTYRINSKACDEAGARLFAWVSNGIQYLLVSEASDKMCEEVRDIMNAPSEIGSL